MDTENNQVNSGIDIKEQGEQGFDAILSEVFDKLSSIHLLRGSQIPDIALYMEQVTEFLGDHTDQFLKNDETVLTKTMINNYTKGGILPRPVNKKYSKEQIMRLNEIFLLKQVYSVAQIGEFYTRLEGNTDHIYDVFFDLAKHLRDEYVTLALERMERIEKALEQCGVHNPAAQIHIYALLTALESSVNRKVCCELLEKIQKD